MREKEEAKQRKKKKKRGDNSPLETVDPSTLPASEEEKALECFLGRILLWKRDGTGEWVISDACKTHVTSVLRSRVGSHVLEKLVEWAPPKFLKGFFKAHLKGRLVEFAMDGTANFVVQKFLQVSKEKSQISVAATELTGEFENLLKNNRSGVVRWLLQACNQASISQQLVTKATIEAIGISNPNHDKSTVTRLLQLGQRGQTHGDDYRGSRFSPMGCAILQTFTEYPFEAVGRVVDSFLASQADQLFQCACDPTGSRVVESFLTSPTFHFHVKHKLLDKFTGKFAALASSKFGSFVLEKAFTLANKSRKILIATELGDAEERLGRSNNGRIMLNNLKISLFKRAPHIWEEQMRTVQKTKDIFADLIDNEPASAQNAPKRKVPSSEHTENDPKQNKKAKVERKEKKNRKQQEEDEELFVLKKKEGDDEGQTNKLEKKKKRKSISAEGTQKDKSTKKKKEKKKKVKARAVPEYALIN